MTLRLPLAGAALAAALGCRSATPASPAPTGHRTTMAMDMTTHGTLPRAPAGGVPGRVPISLTPAQATTIGVTYTTVQRGPLERSVRIVGTIAAPESSLVDVTTRVEGYVERVYVDATGLVVRRGAPLVAIYSPSLVAATQELVSAARLARNGGDSSADRQGRELLEAARRRLALWSISPDQVARIERGGEVTRDLILRAPAPGIVLAKDIVAGQAVQPGSRLYRLADLSTVWVEGDVFESDLADVRVGDPVRIEVAGYPGAPLTGRVGFVSPVVDSAARTATVRVALRNPGGRLRPGMFVTMFLTARLGASLVHVPADAVVRTGEQDIVYVVDRGGRLVPRDVVIGVRAGETLEIRSGLTVGERIVASGNFLVDAESRLIGEGAPMAGMAMPETTGGRR
jgi:multidrug efflux pump subunit AcrA (membrane-fusion protein)